MLDGARERRGFDAAPSPRPPSLLRRSKLWIGSLVLGGKAENKIVSGHIDVFALPPPDGRPLNARNSSRMSREV